MGPATTAPRSRLPAMPADHAPAGARTEPRRPLTRLLVILAMTALFAVSGGLLWVLGINYEGLSGSGASKIHPSTYLLILLFGWMMLTSGNVVGTLVDVAGRRPAAFFLLVATMVSFVQTVLRQGPGMAGLVDTFIPAGLAAMMMLRLSERNLRDIETVIHAVMTANAVMALVELASGHLFFPYRFDGAVFETDLRSSALQGHPLANALVTAPYALALVSGGGTLSGPVRLGLFGLQCLALVAFGGRSGMVITLLLGGGYLLLAAHRALAGGRVPLIAVAATALALTLLPVALGVLANEGFFTTLTSRFFEDGGSANARIKMFDIFGYLPASDILFGPDIGYIDSLRRINGLEWGIENPIVRTLLYQGLLITVLMTIAVTWFLWEIARHARRGIFLPMLGFVILLNTAESIGGKTTLLTKFAVMMICFYRPILGLSRADRKGRAPR
jgi:hypothetical protein